MEVAEEVRHETVRILKRYEKPTDNLTRAEKQALLSLRGNADLTILPADKGKVTVILNTEDYTRKTANLLEDPAYRRLDKQEDLCPDKDVFTAGRGRPAAATK